MLRSTPAQAWQSVGGAMRATGRTIGAVLHAASVTATAREDKAASFIMGLRSNRSGRTGTRCSGCSLRGGGCGGQEGAALGLVGQLAGVGRQQEAPLHFTRSGLAHDAGIALPRAIALLQRGTRITGGDP